MWYPPKDSPIWDVAKPVVQGVILLVLAEVMFKNGRSPQDWAVAAASMISMIGMQKLHDNAPTGGQ